MGIFGWALTLSHSFEGFCLGFGERDCCRWGFWVANAMVLWCCSVGLLGCEVVEAHARQRLLASPLEGNALRFPHLAACFPDEFAVIVAVIGKVYQSCW